ncbi:DUF6075 family protein [Fusibacter sp. JL298sf-3]
MYFIDKNHVTNYQKLLFQDHTHPKDIRRKSLFYIISGNEDLYLRRYSIYDFEIHEILPFNLVDELMSLGGGGRMLLRLAYNLYNGFDDGKLTPRDVFYVMNKRDFIVAKGGIDMRFDMVIEN